MSWQKCRSSWLRPELLLCTLFLARLSRLPADHTVKRRVFLPEYGGKAGDAPRPSLREFNKHVGRGMRTQRTGLSVCLFLLLAPMTYSQTAQPRFEVGPQFATLHFQGSGINTTFGVGGRFVYNPLRFLSLETELNRTIPFSHTSTSFVGGDVTQWFAGAKAGLRKSRFGVFGKVRPGLVHFSNVITSFDPMTFTPGFGKRTTFALDLGGVLEIYASRHWSVRYDAGDTLIHYAPFSLNPSLPPSRPTTIHVFHFTSGVLFRF